MRGHIAWCIILASGIAWADGTQRPDEAAVRALPERLADFEGKKPSVYGDARLGSIRPYYRDDIWVSVYVYPVPQDRKAANLAEDEAARALAELKLAKDKGLYRKAEPLPVPESLSKGLSPLGAVSFHATQFPQDRGRNSAEMRSIIFVTVRGGWFVKTRTTYRRIERDDFSPLVAFHRELLQRLRIPDKPVVPTPHGLARA